MDSSSNGEKWTTPRISLGACALLINDLELGVSIEVPKWVVCAGNISRKCHEDRIKRCLDAPCVSAQPQSQAGKQQCS